MLQQIYPGVYLLKKATTKPPKNHKVHEFPGTQIANFVSLESFEVALPLFHYDVGCDL